MILFKANYNIRLLSNKITTRISALNLRHNDSKNSSRISFNMKKSQVKVNENQTKSKNSSIEKFDAKHSLLNNSQQFKKISNKSSNSDSFSNESLSNLLKSLKENTRIDSFETFEEEILERRSQARNSIYFKFESKSKKNLADLLSDFKLIGVHTNQIFALEDGCLIEFSSKECVNKLVTEYSKLLENSLPFRNRIIVYVSKFNSANLSQTDSNFLKSYNIDYSGLRIKDSKFDSSDFESEKTFNDQLREFYSNNTLDEFSSRMRFFIASLLEDPLKCIFPDCVCLPFGSSINKLGAKSADLDLNLSLSRHDLEFLQKEYEKFHFEKLSLNGDFFFVNKMSHSPSTMVNLKLDAFIDLVENLISNLIPKFETKSILKAARVPIIKFDFVEKPRINCDLSMTERLTAFNMTKLFWIYVHLDERVRLLAFLVRYWATLLTIQAKARPSPNFTNYQITMLVFNFLLRIENPLVIPLEGVIDKNFNIKNLSIKEFKNLFKEKNDLNVGQLFEEFLEYYARFDFGKKNISLSRIQNNNDWNRIYIENPFKPDHNAAKNVNQSQTNRLKSCCEITLNIIRDIKYKNDIDLSKLIKRLQQVNANFVKKKMPR